MTKEQAVNIAKKKWWKDCTPEEITAFQLYEDRLCMDFADFHQAVETTLGRPVFTHEFANADLLRKELEGKIKPASFTDILAKLPADKVVLLMQT